MSSPVGATGLCTHSPPFLELDHRHAHVHEHVQQALQLVERPDLARNHGGHRGGLAAVRCQRERPPVRVPALGVRRLGRLGPERLLHGDHVGVREGVARGERGEVARPGQRAGRERGGGSQETAPGRLGGALLRRGAHLIVRRVAPDRLSRGRDVTAPRERAAAAGLEPGGGHARRDGRAESDGGHRGRMCAAKVACRCRRRSNCRGRRFDVDFILKTRGRRLDASWHAVSQLFSASPKNAQQSSSVSRAPTREP
jgi:hypothetical protein